MIKIKKLLTSLAVIGLTATASTSVVSCGLSVKNLENRTINTSVYKGVYTNAIQNWNLAATMQQADIKLISNTQDSLMTYATGVSKEDYPKPIPQIAEAENYSDTDKALTLKITDNAYWYKSDTGEKVRKITVKDIQNTGRYSLDPANASELVGDWKTLVNGAKEYNATLAKAESEFAKDNDQAKLDKAKADAWTTFEPNIHVTDDTITFKLIEPAKIFESALTTGSFAPTPDEAFTGLNAGYDYGRKDYRNILVSGPYYIAEYVPSTKIELKRNPNYVDGNKGTVDTIDYYYSATGDVASQRRLWEDGDVTDAQVAPSDTYGTKRYKDVLKKLGTVKNNQVGSKSLWFNFTKQDQNGKADVQSNKALSLDSVRTLITYGLDRSRLVKYFSGPNGDGDIDSYFTNSFNPADYLKSDKGEYVKNYLANDFIGNKRSLTSGDAYYLNPALIENTTSLKSKNVKATMDGLIDQVKKDLKTEGLTTAKLTFLTSGVNATTFNPYILQMIRAFNEIKDNPIQIEMQQTNGDSDYQSAQIEGNFSMFITGETPTFIDPISFLNNLYINGTMALYMGTSRLFDSTGQVRHYYDKAGNDIGNAKDKYGINQELINDMTKFTDDVANADKENTNLSTRYADMASAEAEALYNYKIIMPLYIPNGKETNYLTYVDNSTRPNVGYGYQDYRLDKVKLYKSIKSYLNEKDKPKKEYVISNKEN